MFHLDSVADAGGAIDLLVTGFGFGAAEVHTLSVPGPAGGGADVIRGTGAGPGITVAVPPGSYTVYVIDTQDLTYSNPLFVTVTAAGPNQPGVSVYEACANAALDVLGLLHLPTFGAGVGYSRQIQWAETPLNLAFPALVLALDDMSETDESRLNMTFDAGYPLRWMLLDRVGPTDQSRTGAHLLTRQRTVRAFQGQQLSAVAENWITRVEFDTTFRHDAAMYEFLVSELTIRCVCREPTGLNV